ncbi:unnamed protein product [Paramecium sonneborni]|uniref:Uncharacterized protein n=1 Tax=Paramecium sonneborni TaxID=65129 RepID=A0A8S1QRL5_9CILI|nr:unnamed protein product [Paramecium sonneborni]
MLIIYYYLNQNYHQILPCECYISKLYFYQRNAIQNVIQLIIQDRILVQVNQLNLVNQMQLLELMIKLKRMKDIQKFNKIDKSYNEESQQFKLDFMDQKVCYCQMII